MLRKLKITCESSALPGSATSQPKEVGFKTVSKRVSTNFLCDMYGHCSDNKIKLSNNINSTQFEDLLLPVLSSTAWSCCPRSRTSLGAEIVELKHSSCYQLFDKTAGIENLLMRVSTWGSSEGLPKEVRCSASRAPPEASTDVRCASCLQASSVIKINLIYKTTLPTLVCISATITIHPNVHCVYTYNVVRLSLTSWFTFCKMDYLSIAGTAGDTESLGPVTLSLPPLGVTEEGHFLVFFYRTRVWSLGMLVSDSLTD